MSMIEAGRRCKTGHIKKEKRPPEASNSRLSHQQHRLDGKSFERSFRPLAWLLRDRDRSGVNFEQAVFCHDIKIVESMREARHACVQ